MNAYIDCQENLWTAVRATGESWERIIFLKEIIHPLFYINSEMLLSDPNHPANLYGRANDLEGNAIRMYNKVKELIGDNVADYAALLTKIFVDNDSDDDGVSLSSYTAALIHKYMEYIATLNNDVNANHNSNDSE